MELWAGIECTVNRIGDRYLDQLEHLERYAPEELVDLVASLGITKVRFPVLWERIAPGGLASANWEWTDRALARLRAHGIAPIAGLVHHGSGPRDTHLLDPAFPEKLARFADAVARRYPWITDYTPVNEPLTTARFSALYGLWYPHRSELPAMAGAIFQQCAATRAAMDAIRQHVPHARLVQTEDLGKTYSTPYLAYQAEHENLRRWFSLDVLCGLAHDNALVLDGAHKCGIDDFAPFVCVPDILGFNYYITGERFLDERLERYPAAAHGGNQRDRYADVAAVRVCAEGAAGLGALVREAAERYHLPLAVTESHLGCTREEQVRWVAEGYAQARAAAAHGCDVRAFTVWALFGSHDWNTLLTRSDGHYEPGAFDIRSRPPRLTAIGRLVRALATGASFEHPALESPGWWRTVRRLEHPPVARDDVASSSCSATARAVEARTPLLILGTGRLGRAFLEAARARGLEAVALDREACDVTDESRLRVAFARVRPWAVIMCAGSRNPDDAERDLAGAVAVHYRSTLTLARLCTRRGIRLAAFSTNAVFDDPDEAPSYESSPLRPANSYAVVKAAADTALLAAAHDALLVRSGELMGFRDDDPILEVAAQVEAGERVRLPIDDVFSLAHVDDLTAAVLDLLVDGERGLWHVASRGETSWPEILEALAGPGAAEQILPATDAERVAQRPAYAVLASERGDLLPPVGRVLERMRRSRHRFLATAGDEAAS